MPVDGIFEAAFDQLRKAFTTKTKRRFLSEIEGQIEEDEHIQEILQTRPVKRCYATQTTKIVYVGSRSRSTRKCSMLIRATKPYFAKWSNAIGFCGFCCPPH
jgi:hypothetical protein